MTEPTPPGRDERRERRAQAATQWGTYLKKALADQRPPMTPTELARRSNGALDSGQITHWTNGENRASIESALIVARILHRSPAETLRAAGHETVADELDDAAGAPTVKPNAAFGTWLREQAADTTPDEIAAASDRTLTPETVERLMRGEHTPTIAETLLLARILHAPHAAALVAAGHDDVATLMTSAGARDAYATDAARWDELNGITEGLPPERVHEIMEGLAADLAVAHEIARRRGAQMRRALGLDDDGRGA